MAESSGKTSGLRLEAGVIGLRYASLGGIIGSGWWKLAVLQVTVFELLTSSHRTANLHIQSIIGGAGPYKAHAHG